LLLKITEPVSSGKCGKIISYKSEWAFCYQFFAAGAPLNWISHIFWLKPLKPVFCDLKSNFTLILKENTSGSMGMEDLSIDITYDPC
jgi:hypothetical protein